MKLRPLDHVDKAASTRVAFEESVKDNLAEKVIDNFINELTRLSFWKRVRFGLGIIFRR